MRLEKYIPGILLFLTIALLISINHLPSAKADAAPEPGAIASDLYPSDSATKVRMESETVIIDIAKESDYRDGHAIVTAEFHMRNLGEEREEMLVRFPMNHTYNLEYELENGVDYCSQISYYPSIEDFEVWINGQSQYVNITTKTEHDYYSWDPEENITYNCWAKFNVSFPPDQEVLIKVKYKVPGYSHGGGDVSYEYVLRTGAGWYDTIGSADIIVRFPYEINKYNLGRGKFDENNVDEFLLEHNRYLQYELSRNEIFWHFEDFEPTAIDGFSGNFSITFLDPAIWNQILIERENIKLDPNDGEAWGRLGRAYKEAVTEGKGYIYHTHKPELFQMSQEAYQKALELLPDDIEWHYGYAELVCIDSMFHDPVNDPLSSPIRNECTEQLKYILDLDPDHEDALFLLEWTRNWTMSYPEHEIAEHLLLTPMATRTYTPTSTTTVTTKPYLTSTAIPSKTPSPAKTEIITTNTPTPSLESYESSNIEQNRLIFSIGANILLVAFLFFAIRPDRSNK